MLGRSLGSGPWLFPLETKQDTKKMLHVATPQSTMANVEIESLDIPQLPSCPAITLRHESSLHISIPSQRLCLEKFLHRRETLPSKVRLAICIGKKIKVKTDFCSVSTGKIGRSSAMVNFGNETIILACPPTIEEALKLHTYIQIQIEEPGAGAPSKRRKGIFDCDVLWPIRCLFCLFRWVCCLPCSIVRKSLCVMTKGAKKGASAGAAALGSTRVIGESEKVEWKRNIMKNSRENDDVEKLGGKWHDLQIGLEPIEKYRYGFFLQAPSPEKMLIKCRWKPPPVPPDSKTTSTVCHQSAKDISYQTSYAQQLLSIEGLSNAIQLMNETYGKDPIGPHSLSAFFPPPIKKVIAIYGINLPTEVRLVLCKNHDLLLECTLPNVIDTNFSSLFYKSMSASTGGRYLPAQSKCSFITVQCRKVPPITLCAGQRCISG